MKSEKNNIEKLRKKKGWTRDELATYSGINVNSVYFYESDRLDLMNSEIGTLIKLCKVFNCPITSLFADKKEKRQIRNVCYVKRKGGKK